MADTNKNKPVDLEGLNTLVRKIKTDYAKKTDVEAEVTKQLEEVETPQYATTEEILALFDDDGEEIDDDI